MKMLSGLSRSTILFIALTVAYLSFPFILPTSNLAAANYELTDAEYRYLLFLTRLPGVMLWVVTYISYRVFFHYARRIKNTPEGADFGAMSRGMFWVAWGLPVSVIIASIIAAFINSYPQTRMISLITINYLYVIVSLFAFSYVCGGAYRLADRSHFHLSTKHIRLLIFGLVGLGVLFCYIIASKLHGSGLGDSLNSYYLPNGLVWLTIVIPYLYAWFVGLFAALQLLLVAHHTSGVIYRQALQTLAFGLVTIIVAMICLQYFRSIVPRTGVLRINNALIMTYGIYALQAFGSILLILGARRLKKIEDV